MLPVYSLTVVTNFAYDIARYLLRMAIIPLRLAGVALAFIVAWTLFVAWVCGYLYQTSSK